MRRAFTAAVLLFATGAGAASATPNMSFSTPFRIHRGTAPGGNDIVAISCPSARLCVALNRAGDVLTSRQPATGRALWHAVHVDDAEPGTEAQFADLTCPTVQFCAAIDGEGVVFTSTNPTGRRRAWHVALRSRKSLVGISCPSRRLCALTTNAWYDVITSTNPAAAASSWHATHVANELWAISCPSTAMCVVMPGDVGTIVSRNPTGGAADWSSFRQPGDLTADDPHGAGWITCPSTTTCVAVDSSDRLFTSTDLAAGANAAWRAADTGNKELWRISCPTVGFCAGTGLSGVTLTDPRTGDWRTIPIQDGTAWLSGGVSCPSPTLCLGADGGNAVVGIPPLDVASVRLRLRNALASAVESLHRFTFTAQSAGRLHVSVSAGRHVVALTTATFHDAARRTIKLRLTAFGHRLLERRAQPRLQARGSFTPAGQPPIAFR